jgi:hypothetical protein
MQIRRFQHCINQTKHQVHPATTGSAFSCCSELLYAAHCYPKAWPACKLLALQVMNRSHLQSAASAAGAFRIFIANVQLTAASARGCVNKKM